MTVLALALCGTIVGFVLWPAEVYFWLACLGNVMFFLVGRPWGRPPVPALTPENAEASDAGNEGR